MWYRVYSINKPEPVIYDSEENIYLFHKDITYCNEMRDDDIPEEYAPGRWRFLRCKVSKDQYEFFRDYFGSLKEIDKQRADIDYLAMVGGVDLDE